MNETVAVTMFQENHSMYSVLCQDHLFHLFWFLVEMSPFNFALWAAFSMNKEKQL